MSGSDDRIDELVRRARVERQELVAQVSNVREAIERKRRDWRIAGWIATGLAAGLTAAYRLFGKGSLAAQIGRYSSGVSVAVGLGRLAMRLRRLF